MFNPFSVSTVWVSLQETKKKQQIADEMMFGSKPAAATSRKRVAGFAASKQLSTESCRAKVQGHHHNGDHAARRPHILCSICVHSFGALIKAVRLFVTSQPANVLSLVLH